MSFKCGPFSWPLAPSFLLFLPILWERAEIFPIFKRGDSSDPNNYRSISLTFVTFKLFETITSDQLHPFLEFEGIPRLPIWIPIRSFHRWSAGLRLIPGLSHSISGAKHIWPLSTSPKHSNKFGAKVCWRNYPRLGSLQLSYRGHRVNHLRPNQWASISAVPREFRFSPRFHARTHCLFINDSLSNMPI